MFPFLQVSDSSNKSVEIIKAIGGTWPFLLTVTAILILIIYGKSIARYFEKFNKVSGKTPIIELSLEKSKIEIKSEENESQQSVETPQNDDSKKEEVTKKKDPDFFDIYLKLRDNDFKSADNLFNEMQNLESDSIQKERNEYVILSLKYRYGGINTINNLKERITKVTNRNLKYFGYKSLGDVYFHGKNYPEALENYNIAFLNANNENEKIEVVSEIIACMKESGNKDGAIKYLKEFKDEVIIAENKSKVFKLIANLYFEKDEWLLKCLALEMAISNNPNDTALLFELGYSYSKRYDESDDKIVSMAMLHYTELIKYKPKSEGGFNNLGVAYSDLGMQGEAVKYYKKSIELGNSLAASNIANKYIHQGFYEEAKEMLDKVKDQKDISENVWASLNELSKKEKAETEQTEQVFKRAKQEQAFLKKFANTYFSAECGLKNLEGEWLCNTDSVQVKLTPNFKYYQLTWINNNRNFSITFKIADSLSLVGEGSCYPKDGGLTNRLNVFAILNEDNTQIDLLLFDMRDKTSFNYSVIKK